MTLREVIDRLDEFADDDTIYAESIHPTARAVVATEPEDGSIPCGAAGLAYLLEVAAARDAIEVWKTWATRPASDAERQARSRDVLPAERCVVTDRVPASGDIPERWRTREPCSDIFPVRLGYIRSNQRARSVIGSCGPPRPSIHG